MRGRPLVSVAEIAASAESFRSRFAPNTMGPLAIDAIVEHDLGIRIEPVRNLCRDTHAKAWLCNDGKMIVVDRHIMLRQPSEFRQVIAHEAAHSERHKAYLPKEPFTSIDDCKKYHATLSAALLAAMEWEATVWAGMVLVPPRQLEWRVGTAAEEYKWIGEVFGTDGGPILNDMVIESVARWFGVLPSIAERRMRDDHMFGLVRPLKEVRSSHRLSS